MCVGLCFADQHMFNICLRNNGIPGHSLHRTSADLARAYILYTLGSSVATEDQARMLTHAARRHGLARARPRREPRPSTWPTYSMPKMLGRPPAAVFVDHHAVCTDNAWQRRPAARCFTARSARTGLLLWAWASRRRSPASGPGPASPSCTARCGETPPRAHAWQSRSLGS